MSMSLKVWDRNVSQKLKQRKEKFRKAALRASAVSRKYNVSIADLLIMYSKQKNCCKICGNKFPYKNLCVDHNHKTGEIRGLLCSNCNSGLGMFKDSIAYLLKAVGYLNDYL